MGKDSSQGPNIHSVEGSTEQEGHSLGRMDEESSTQREKRRSGRGKDEGRMKVDQRLEDKETHESMERELFETRLQLEAKVVYDIRALYEAHICT